MRPQGPTREPTDLLEFEPSEFELGPPSINMHNAADVFLSRPPRQCRRPKLTFGAYDRSDRIDGEGSPVLFNHSLRDKQPSFIRRIVLIIAVAETICNVAVSSDVQFPIKVDGHVLFGDLLVQSDAQKILVEAEMGSKRIMNDLAKAQALGCPLWVLIPNPNVARSVRRKLLQQSIKLGTIGIFILSLTQAIQRLEHFFELNSGSNAASENKKETTS